MTNAVSCQNEFGLIHGITLGNAAQINANAGEGFAGAVRFNGEVLHADHGFMQLVF